MQNALPAPTATGSLAKTPFPHLLIYALERRLTGTFELSLGDDSVATLLVRDGFPAKVRPSDRVQPLGAVLEELGMITGAQREAALAVAQQAGLLLGQALLAAGALDAATLEAGLRSQVERRVEHLFGLPAEAAFAYYDGLDLLARDGGAPAPIDPFPVLWRGVRERAPAAHVEATLQRVGGARLEVAPTAQLERFALSADEQLLIARLRQAPMGLAEFASALPGRAGPHLAYLLVAMKQVELRDAGALAPGAPASAARPLGTAGLPSTPVTGRAFARVQLQRQPATRAPLVVEEHVTPAGNDDRASSPSVQTASAFGLQRPARSAFGPVPSPTPAPVAAATGEPGHLASVIADTLQDAAIPPPASSARLPSAPVSATGSAPPASLTPEQDALKAKIVERAEQITSQDYFQMLGLERDAAPEAAKKAFITLAKIWHPDRLPPALLDVKDACTKVFSLLTDAHATLTDPERRQEYLTVMKDGGATPDDQAKIQAVLEAATEFQKAEFLLKRNLADPKAYQMVKRAYALDPEQADYLAMLTWIDAQKPEWQSREKTLEKVGVLDLCIKKSPACERAYFYRGMLHKRADEPAKALKDFKKAADLNPRNLDAVREVRLHNMRSGTSKPPPDMGSGRTSKPPPSESIGGLFGRLFKK